MPNFYRRGDCSICPKTDTTIAKKIGAKKYCVWCNQARLKARKVKKEPSGQVDLFWQIWNERPQKCVITGRKINIKPFTDQWFHCFSHILPKGAYPAFKLKPENIVLKLPEIHHQYHNTPKSDLLTGEYSEKWHELFELKEKLIVEYHKIC